MQESQKRAIYVLVTAAYNEGRMIEQTIKSVVSQSHRPAKWVIVSDGSTDDTDAIVSRYASAHHFIQLCRLTEDHPRNFTAQAYAINSGIAQLAESNFDFIGNLDADITMGPSYFADLMQGFHDDPQLGLAGGAVTERCEDGTFRERKDNSPSSVAHAVQLFRRKCFQDVGGQYAALPFGGPDTYAEVTARMNGWRVKSFSELPVQHHRATGSAGGVLRSCFRQGRMDHSLGTLPLYQLLKVLRRMPVSPYVIGATARFFGFVFAYLRREPRAVSGNFVVYFRQEQSNRIRNLLKLNVPKRTDTRPVLQQTRN
jgi:glycosyltransferase involved in cell wall biosynthesis